MARSSSGDSIVDRVVRILESFDPDTSSLSVTELALRAVLPSSTASRLIDQLIEHGLLRRDANRRIRIGVRVWELGVVGAIENEWFIGVRGRGGGGGSTGKVAQRPVVIVCDESGSNGENLAEGAARVFAHGSTDLDVDDAGRIIDQLRLTVRFGGSEIKSAALLKSEGRREKLLELFAPAGPLPGRGKVVVIDKPS